jgi:hypothetical protein
VTEKNISKVVRTTRNDFALGTSAGIVFCKLAKDHQTGNPVLIANNGETLLEQKDITEVSEFAQDKFIIGLWNENDFLVLDRNHTD